MNLQFIRQAIYQQSGDNAEHELAKAQQEVWKPTPLPEALIQKEPVAVTEEKSLPNGVPQFQPSEDDRLDLEAELQEGVDFRISPLVDSRQSRLEERKALEEFSELQSEAKVLRLPDDQEMVNKMLIINGSSQPKRVRPAVRVDRVPSPISQPATAAHGSVSLLANYESDSED